MRDKAKAFSPIRKSRRAFEEVAFDIKESILSGVWKAGDRLPSETELSNQFEVSRHTIREALRTLEHSGFVTIKTGVAGGPIVKDSISERINNLFLDAFRMEKISVEDFTAARLVIEKAISDDAIDHADEQDIENLKECLAKAKELIRKKRTATSENFQFHSLLAKASKNNAFVLLESSILAIHIHFRSRKPVDFETSKRTVLLHEKILDALIKKDREKVFRLLEQHTSKIRKSLGNP
jgi:GntR family transcriptional repressor for pyruvate dehydrogenase complex